MYLASAYIISAATYLFLLLLDALRPGFVSYQFSAHWLLLLVILLAALLSARQYVFASHVRVERIIVVCASIVVAGATWFYGRSLGDAWLLLVLLSAAIPPLIYHTLKSDL